eukprot:235316_1
MKRLRGTKMQIFIGLIILSGGCYPALAFLSSGILGLNLFDSGLSKHELRLLSKIKIQSTILQENLPQIIIQFVYVWVTLTQSTEDRPTIPEPVVFAFVGSALSVIMAVASYCGQKTNMKDSTVMSYYLLFGDKNKALSVEHRALIKKHKGRKQHLKKNMAQALGISDDEIEIGFVWTNNDGLEMRISHFVTKGELAKHTRNKGGYISEITPESYLRKVYGLKKTQESMNEVSQNHFEIDDAGFSVQFVLETGGGVAMNPEFKSLSQGSYIEDEEGGFIPTHGQRHTGTAVRGEMIEMRRMMQQLMDQQHGRHEEIDDEKDVDNDDLMEQIQDMKKSIQSIVSMLQNKQ